MLTRFREWCFVEAIRYSGQQNLGLFFETYALDHFGEDFNRKFAILLDLVVEGNNEPASKLLPVVVLDDLVRLLVDCRFIELN